MAVDILPRLPMFLDCEVRHIPNFPGYAATSAGDILSYKGARGLRHSWKSLKGSPGRQKYLRYGLCRDGEVIYRSGHQLVLEAFIGPCPPGLEGCHENRNPSDNRLANLRWDTRKNNHADKKKHGTSQEGERHGMVRLPDTSIYEIRQLFSQGIPVRIIMKLYNLSDTHVYRIVNYKTRKNI